MDTRTSPTTEDRVWTVLAHLSALSFGMGILLPVVGWSDQRRKSSYASFQCLQALGYQSLGFTIWVLSYLVLVILASLILLFVFVPDGNEQAAPDIVTPALVMFLLVVFVPLLLYFILPVIAAVACAFGKDYRYPILGNRLARYLGYESAPRSEQQAWLNEEHEMRWVAAMGHFSILILFWGMLAPLTAWVLQGKNDRFLKFQSIQTLAYHAATTLVYLIGGFFYLFGFVVLLTSLEGMGGSDLSSTLGMIGLATMIVSFVIAAVLLLAMPLLHILGQWAGYRVLKGENYRYPLLGRLVERQIAKTTMIEEKSP
jgi:uncharacterized Tic20 family protein